VAQTHHRRREHRENATSCRDHSRWILSPSICSGRSYQITLRPSCIRRAVMRVLVIAPNVGLWVFTFALPNCVWFKVLKVSQRNWVFTLSVTRKFLNKLVSQLLMPG